MNRAEFRAISKLHGRDKAIVVETDLNFINQTVDAMKKMKRSDFIKAYDSGASRLHLQHDGFASVYKRPGWFSRNIFTRRFIKKVGKIINLRSALINKIRFDSMNRG